MSSLLLAFSSRRSLQLISRRLVSLSSSSSPSSVGNRTRMMRTSNGGSADMFPVTAAITANLTSAFQPSHLEVINESHKHNVPKNSETHFKVVVVSTEFEKAKTPIQRHRLVNTALAEQLDGPVHALSIVAKTPNQWQKMIDAGQTKIEPSPACRGGDGSLPKPGDS